MSKATQSVARRPCAVGREHHKLIRGKLGPMPDAALRAMVGYGLNEREIGRYFGVTPSSVRRLTRSLKVVAPSSE